MPDAIAYEEFTRGWNALARWIKMWFKLDIEDKDLGNISKLKEALEQSLPTVAWRKGDGRKTAK